MWQSEFTVAEQGEKVLCLFSQKRRLLCVVLGGGDPATQRNEQAGLPFPKLNFVLLRHVCKDLYFCFTLMAELIFVFFKRCFPGARDGSLVKVLAGQAREPEFGFPVPRQNLGTVVLTCNPNTGNRRRIPAQLTGQLV